MFTSQWNSADVHSVWIPILRLLSSLPLHQCAILNRRTKTAFQHTAVQRNRGFNLDPDGDMSSDVWKLFLKQGTKRRTMVLHIQKQTDISSHVSSILSSIQQNCLALNHISISITNSVFKGRFTNGNKQFVQYLFRLWPMLLKFEIRNPNDPDELFDFSILPQSLICIQIDHYHPFYSSSQPVGSSKHICMESIVIHDEDPRFNGFSHPIQLFYPILLNTFPNLRALSLHVPVDQIRDTRALLTDIPSLESLTFYCFVITDRGYQSIISPIKQEQSQRYSNIKRLIIYLKYDILSLDHPGCLFMQDVLYSDDKITHLQLINVHHLRTLLIQLSSMKYLQYLVIMTHPRIIREEFMCLEQLIVSLFNQSNIKELWIEGKLYYHSKLITEQQLAIMSEQKTIQSIRSVHTYYEYYPNV